jgi:hypothetical protein
MSDEAGAVSPAVTPARLLELGSILINRRVAGAASGGSRPRSFSLPPTKMPRSYRCDGECPHAV